MNDNPTDSEKLTSIIRHIKMVENNCNIISQKLMDTDPMFAINIAKRGRIHDASKFDDLEFKYLWKGSKLFDIALLNHHTQNTHHPEHFLNSVWGFSNLDLAEYTCDCIARSQEFGTDPRIWLLNIAAKKYGYINDQKIMADIEMYINMVLSKPFK